MHTEPRGETGGEFRYFLHAWRRDPGSGLGRCNELFATDGGRVRMVRGRGSFLTFEEIDGRETARRIVETIEREWKPEAVLLGYDAPTEHSCVAILRHGDEEAARWAVFPCGRAAFPSEISSGPADLESDGWRVHLVGGGEVGWRGGEPVLRGALEVRAWGATSIDRQVELLEAVRSAQLRAFSGEEGEFSEVGLVPRSECRVRPERTEADRLEFEFPLDRVIYRKYSGRADFRLWYELECAPDLFPVPEPWRRLWMRVEVEER